MNDADSRTGNRPGEGEDAVNRIRAARRLRRDQPVGRWPDVLASALRREIPDLPSQRTRR